MIKKNPTLSGIFFNVLFHIYALVTESDFNDVGSGCWYFYAGLGVVEFTDGKHLPLHVHDGVTLGKARQGFIHHDFEFKRRCHLDAERRLGCFVLFVIFVLAVIALARAGF